MNGFVKFREETGAESFLSSPRIRAISSKGQLVPTGSKEVLIFREFNEDDVKAIATVAEAMGGRVIPSTQYEPL